MMHIVLLAVLTFTLCDAWRKNIAVNKLSTNVWQNAFRKFQITPRKERMAETVLFAAPPPATTNSAEPKKKVPKEDVITVNGRVVESLPNATFKVEIEPSKQIVLATVSGKIRKNFVRVIVGDKVTVELSAFDLSKGRITFRYK